MTTRIVLVVFGLVMPVASHASAAVTVDGTRIVAKTAAAVATFDGPALVSFKPAGADVEFVHDVRPPFALELVYVTGGATLQKDKHETLTVRSLSPQAALVVVQGEDSRRELLITTDDDTGDICVTPSGMSNRRTLLAVRWTMSLADPADAILPVVNGLYVPANKAWPPAGRFPWPFQWNAQLAIAQRDGYACMIHSEDRLLTFKALNLARPDNRRELGFDTEMPGPIWDTRTAGGVTWRLSAYKGDWQVPATRYRRWMERAYDLPARRAHRPAWGDRVTLAVCWAEPRTDMLDALAAAHPPDQTLIHLSNWRTDKYDLNYPEYTPREDTIAYMTKAKHMGFHVMPHFNYFAVYYKNPFYEEVRDFQIRDVRTNEPQGWHWPPETHDYTRMGYIHPGLTHWRRKLIDVLLGACDRLDTDVAFIDQTLCTWNTDNGLVEGMNTIAGMQRLQDEFAMIRPDLVLVGEGLNEISFQRQCFAQGHIHDGWRGLETTHVDAAHPICAFLWAGHTRLIGYFKLNPDDPQFPLAIDVYERMGALPTITTNNPEYIRTMAEGTKRIFDAARRNGNAVTRPALADTP